MCLCMTSLTEQLLPAQITTGAWPGHSSHVYAEATRLRSCFDAACSLPEEEDPPQPLLSSESLEWDAIANLDDFFRRIYKCAGRTDVMLPV